jgi:methylamine utilization protein MauE
MSAVSFGCQCVLILVFAVSATSKIRDRTSLRAFRVATTTLLPRGAVRAAAPVAAAVIVTEIACVVTLALPGTVRIGLLLSIGLLAAFTLAIGTALRRGTAVPCRCFGASAAPLGVRHLVRNGILITIAGAAVLTDGQRSGALTELATATGAAAVVALLLINLDAVVDLFAAAPASAPRRP